MSVQNGGIPSDETSTAFTILTAQFPNSSDPNEKIQTDEFLEASRGVVSLVERFGKVFAPVIYDMNGNIKKITEKYLEDEEKHQYLEDMVLREQTEGGLLVTDALQWLRRALHFITCFFQFVIDDTETDTQDLTPFVKQAYSDTLQRYHGWLGTQLFNVLTRFAPTRQNLLYKLALERNNKEDYVLRDMRNFTSRMSGCVNKLVKFYAENNLETVQRV